MEKPLAAYCMAYDEADVLPRALESLEPLRDIAEVFVSIDHKTEDGTAEIAAEYADHVGEHRGLPALDDVDEEDLRQDSRESQNSFARMRNDVHDWICELSDASYILWLDADEWLECGHDEIRAAMETYLEKPEDQQPDLFHLRVEDLNQEGQITRGWDNNKILARDIRFKYRRHEAPENISVPAVRIDGAVIQHQHPEGKKSRRMQKKDELAYLADYLAHFDQRTAFYYGDFVAQANQWAPAEALMTRACQMKESSVQADAASSLISIRRQIGDLNGAKDAAKLLLHTDWRRLDAPFHLGSIEAERGNLDEADFWLSIAAELDAPPAISQVNREHVTDLPWVGRAQIAVKQERWQDGFDYLEKARSYGNNRAIFQKLRTEIQDQIAGEGFERDRDNLIVVSGGMRTGTTWLADVFNRLGRFVNEPFVLAGRGHYREPENEQCTGEFAEYARELFDERGLLYQRAGFTDEETEHLVSLFRQFPKNWQDAIGFKDALPQIAAQTWPDCQIVVLERDTASVMASIAKRWGKGPDVSAIGNALPDGMWESIIEDQGYDTDLERRRFEQAAQNEILQRLDRQNLLLSSANYRVYEHEELTTNYHHVMPELLDWLGFQDIEAAYDAVMPLMNVPPDRPPQNPEQRREFVKIAAAIEDTVRWAFEDYAEELKEQAFALKDRLRDE